MTSPVQINHRRFEQTAHNPTMLPETEEASDPKSKPSKIDINTSNPIPWSYCPLLTCQSLSISTHLQAMKPFRPAMLRSEKLWFCFVSGIDRQLGRSPLGFSLPKLGHPFFQILLPVGCDVPTVFGPNGTHRKTSWGRGHSCGSPDASAGARS